MDKTSGGLRRRQAPNHEPTKHNEQNPSNRQKSKAAAKIRRHAQGSNVFAVFFYAAAIFLLYIKLNEDFVNAEFEKALGKMGQNFD